MTPDKLKRLACLVVCGLLVTACSNGGGSSNRAPQIATIADATISANEASQPIAVAVSDRGAVNLIVSSDNLALIDAGAIAVDGDGADFTLVLTPIEGVLGVSNITVTATDAQGLSASRTFAVTVEPQQVGFAAFTRDVFADDANATPRDLNSRVISADAQNDAFADLLGQ